jgi:hypothetical protein
MPATQSANSHGIRVIREIRGFLQSGKQLPKLQRAQSPDESGMPAFDSKRPKDS